MEKPREISGTAVGKMNREFGVIQRGGMRRKKKSETGKVEVEKGKRRQSDKVVA